MTAPEHDPCSLDPGASPDQYPEGTAARVLQEAVMTALWPMPPEGIGYASLVVAELAARGWMLVRLPAPGEAVVVVADPRLPDVEVGS